MSIYFAVELSLKEISYVMYVHAVKRQKSCAVGMRNAILRNHLKDIQRRGKGPVKDQLEKTQIEMKFYDDWS